MALITCPECGKQISDKADKCIHCGFPLGHFDTPKVVQIKDGDDITDVQVSKESSQSGTDAVPFLFILALVIGFGIFYYKFVYEPEQKKEMAEIAQSEGKVDNNTTNNAQGNQSGSESETRQTPIENQPTIEDRIAEEFHANIYSRSSYGSTTTIKFDSEGNRYAGSMVVKNSNENCTLYFKYKISGHIINATFYGSDCGNESINHTLIYNENNNSLTFYSATGALILRPSSR